MEFIMLLLTLTFALSGAMLINQSLIWLLGKVKERFLLRRIGLAKVEYGKRSRKYLEDRNAASIEWVAKGNPDRLFKYEHEPPSKRRVFEEFGLDLDELRSVYKYRKLV